MKQISNPRTSKEFIIVTKMEVEEQDTNFGATEETSTTVAPSSDPENDQPAVLEVNHNETGPGDMKINMVCF